MRRVDRVNATTFVWRVDRIVTSGITSTFGGYSNLVTSSASTSSSGARTRRKDQILANKRREASVQDAIEYFDNMASYVDELRTLQNELRERIRRHVNLSLSDASHKEAYGVIILVLVLAVSPIIIILVRNAVATIQVPGD
uniref:Uncharacterized protein n=2 Tax=Timema TaxID=61471 RepID=A0A7R9HHT6_TIMPO|nr:unnamed protein product [Timema poppensis]